MGHDADSAAPHTDDTAWGSENSKVGPCSAVASADDTRALFLNSNQFQVQQCFILQLNSRKYWMIHCLSQINLVDFSYYFHLQWSSDCHLWNKPGPHQSQENWGSSSSWIWTWKMHVMNLFCHFMLLMKLRMLQIQCRTTSLLWVIVNHSCLFGPFLARAPHCLNQVLQALALRCSTSLYNTLQCSIVDQPESNLIIECFD